MAKGKTRDKSLPAWRAGRAQIRAEESLERMEAFPEQKEHFVAAVRKGKDRRGSI